MVQQAYFPNRGNSAQYQAGFEPKVALITTTINIPTVLATYHEFDPTVAIFVAGDLKTPEPKVADFVNTLGPDATYLSVETQKKLGYACSDLIGWNCIQRRNIALLEALRWGADIVVTVDDDNIPLDRSYFDRFVAVLTSPYAGLCAHGFAGWFDVGQLLTPPAKHRGIPHDVKCLWRGDAVTGAKVGVAAGVCLGDPDIDAVTRIANAPTVHGVTAPLEAGLVVDTYTTRTVFNSQNTAFIREIAPAMFMMPGVGRYDDIFASLIAQAIMRKRKMFTHFGHPQVWQQRNGHNLITDLRQEIDGMANVRRFSELLDEIKVTDGSVARMTSLYYALLNDAGCLPGPSILAALAWCEDVEKVMGCT